jgi:hypothetical protein
VNENDPATCSSQVIDGEFRYFIVSHLSSDTSSKRAGLKNVIRDSNLTDLLGSVFDFFSG